MVAQPERATVCGSMALDTGLPDMQRQQAVVDCPRSMVGRVIGKGGETIKALQQYTGAMIQIDQSVEPTKVTVAGSAQSLQLAVSMIRDIVAGNFKGFALLRQLTSNTGFHTAQGFDQLSQAHPVYVEGYGFVPPSQADLLRGAAMSAGVTSAALTPPSAISAMPLGLLGTTLLGMPQGLPNGLGSLSLGGSHTAATAVPIADKVSGALGTGLPYIDSIASRPLGVTNLAEFSQVSNEYPTAVSQPMVSLGGQAGTAIALPFGWMTMADPEGRVFYFNGLTGQAQWSLPGL